MTARGEMLTLRDEDGKMHQFSLVDVVEVDGQRYAILQPSQEAEPAVVFRVDGDTLVAVEDDGEFRRVAAAIEETADYDDVEVVDDQAAGRGRGLDPHDEEDGGSPVM